MTWSEMLSALLGIGGSGGGVVMLVRARSANRKINADSAAVLSASSTSYAAGLTEDLADLRAEFDSFRREQGVRDREQQVRERQQYRLLFNHSHWDDQATHQIRSLGGEITDPPPLYLAS